MGKRWPVLGLGVAAAIVIVDQISKYVIVERVMRPEGVNETPFHTSKVVEVLPFFQLRMAWNPGISFSWFNSGEQGTVTILLVLTIALSLGILWLLWRTERTLAQVALAFILGGAVGNVIDRATIGAVVDFLDFYWGAWHFPTFNVADASINIGVALWLLDAVLDRPQHAAQLKDPAP